MPTPAAPPRKPESDDVPAGLPPLDGDVDDDRATDPERLDDDEMPKDDGGDPFDDATGDGDPAELTAADGAILDEEGASLLDAADADALDIGAPDLVGVEGERLTGDEPEENALEDYGLTDNEATSIADAGEEGPSTMDESLSAEGLPPLDADDDGAPEDAEAFFDDNLFAGSRDAWASVWERFGTPLSLGPVRGLVRTAKGVLVAGREIARVDLEGGVEVLAVRGLRGGEVTRVASASDAIFATTDAGGLFVSRDRGASFVESAEWRTLVRPEEAALGLEIVGSDRTGIWGRTAQGGLLSSTDSGRSWRKADVDGFARGIGMDDEGRPVTLVHAFGTSEILRRSGDTWKRTVVPAERLGDAPTGPAMVVACGRAAAIAVEGEGVLRSTGAGAWERIEGTARVTALAMMDTSGALIVAIADGEGEAQSSLLYVGSDGKAQVVATWEERGDGDGAARAIVVDEEHQVVWVGGAFGVIAFQPRIRT